MIKAMIPIIITYSALLAILWAIYLLLNGQFNLSLAWALSAVLFDCLDGYWARKLKQTSEMGKQLDSFGDVFIYLLYPVLVYLMVFNLRSWWVLVLYAWLMSSGIFRLARFTVSGFSQDKNSNLYYSGMPVYFNYLPLLVFWWWLVQAGVVSMVLAGLILFFSGCLMVSKLKFSKPMKIWPVVIGLGLLIWTSLNMSLTLQK